MTGEIENYLFVHPDRLNTKSLMFGEANGAEIISPKIPCPAGTTSTISKVKLLYLFFLHHFLKYIYEHKLYSAPVFVLWDAEPLCSCREFPDIVFILSVKILHIEKMLRLLERIWEQQRSDYHYLWFKPCVMLQHLKKKVSIQKVRNSIWAVCSAWQVPNLNFYKGYGCADESLCVEINSHEGF